MLLQVSHAACPPCLELTDLPDFRALCHPHPRPLPPRPPGLRAHLSQRSPSHDLALFSSWHFPLVRVRSRIYYLLCCLGCLSSL